MRPWLAYGIKIALGVVAVATLAACTASGGSPAPTTDVRTVVSTVTNTRSPSAPATVPPYTPLPTAHPLRPGDDPRKGEKERTCPYIKAGLNVEPTEGPNVADIEGNRIYRVTVLTTLTPVGCRFYYYAGSYEAAADILPQTFASAAAAHAALQSIIVHGKQAESRPNFVAGVDGVRFRSPFFATDHGADWAFAFAKGRVLVIIRTQQTNVSVNGEQLAKAVVGRF